MFVCLSVSLSEAVMTVMTILRFYDIKVSHWTFAMSLSFCVCVCVRVDTFVPVISRMK